MQCARCRTSAVLYQQYSGRYLCADHLCADIESRAKRVIRQNGWLRRGDRIGVFSGMCNSDILLIFLRRLIGGRTDVSLMLLDSPICEGGSDEYSVNQALSRIATEAGVTRVAFADTAEDSAIQTLTLLFRNDVSSLLGDAITGLSLPFMRPFWEIPVNELELYAGRHRVTQKADYPHTLEIHQSPEGSIRDLLMDFTSRHPSAPHALRHYRDNLRSLAERE